MAAAPAQARSTNFVQYFLLIGMPIDSDEPRRNDPPVTRRDVDGCVFWPTE